MSGVVYGRYNSIPPQYMNQHYWSHAAEQQHPSSIYDQTPEEVLDLSYQQRLTNALCQGNGLEEGDEAPEPIYGLHQPGNQLRTAAYFQPLPDGYSTQYCLRCVNHGHTSYDDPQHKCEFGLCKCALCGGTPPKMYREDIVKQGSPLHDDYEEKAKSEQSLHEPTPIIYTPPQQFPSPNTPASAACNCSFPDCLHCCARPPMSAAYETLGLLPSQVVMQERRQSRDTTPNKSPDRRTPDSKYKRSCQKCHQHGITVAMKGHKNFCPYRCCPCNLCLRIDRMRSHFATMYRGGRQTSERQSANQNDRSVVYPQYDYNGELMEQYKGQSLIQHSKVTAAAASLLTNSQKRVCAKCRQHGEMIPLQGHKFHCPYRSCKCAGCNMINSSRSKAAMLQKLHRNNSKDNEDSSDKDFSGEDTSSTRGMEDALDSEGKVKIAVRMLSSAVQAVSELLSTVQQEELRNERLPADVDKCLEVVEDVVSQLRKLKTVKADTETEQRDCQLQPLATVVSPSEQVMS